ncbi:hypothetical protein [Kitasatospora sp. NPDC059462]|uniref:hypothetical protein n=1 Tax=Kitasatospora sp. NPDC059462 TaxID=3346841 RepID=UPI00367579BE
MSEESERIRHGVGHYAVDVALALAEDGVPAAVHAVHGSGDQEPSAVVLVNLTVGQRVVPDGLCGLGWDCVSGWFFFTGDPARPRKELMAGVRWLSDGQVPPPARLRSFLSAVLLDPASAGSAERPYYAVPGGGPGLADRLAPYLSHTVSEPWQQRFADRQQMALHARVLEYLRDDIDEVVMLPLRAGELRAVVELLELHDLTGRYLYPMGRLAGHLARDLEARVAAGLSLEPAAGVVYTQILREENDAMAAQIEAERLAMRRDYGPDVPADLPPIDFS